MKSISGMYTGDGCIGIIAGPCSARSYDQTMEQAHSVNLVKEAVEPFDIFVAYRSGIWKPCTKSYDKNGNGVFEGVGKKGMPWMREVANTYGMPVVIEDMSELDIKHFKKYLEPERDFIQVGARTSQGFALLYRIGKTRFNVLLKNPMQGIKLDAAEGSLMRLKKNGTIIYCVRGQEFIAPDGIYDGAFQKYLEEHLYESPDQDADSRNFNNVSSINALRESEYMSEKGVLFAYDPSHTFGGKNDRIRRKIGEQALKAVKEYGYQVLEIEVDDWSSHAKTDAYQALLTTANGVKWSETNAHQGKNVIPGGGSEPDVMPLTLVDIASDLVMYQAGRKSIPSDDASVTEALRKLNDISWDMSSVAGVSI